jgi:hypothetical protein
VKVKVSHFVNQEQKHCYIATPRLPPTASLLLPVQKRERPVCQLSMELNVVSMCPKPHRDTSARRPLLAFRPSCTTMAVRFAYWTLLLATVRGTIGGSCRRRPRALQGAGPTRCIYGSSSLKKTSTRSGFTSWLGTKSCCVSIGHRQAVWSSSKSSTFSHFPNVGCKKAGSPPTPQPA